jgi:hypothetical protein
MTPSGIGSALTTTTPRTPSLTGYLTLFLTIRVCELINNVWSKLVRICSNLKYIQHMTSDVVYWLPCHCVTVSLWLCHCHCVIVSLCHCHCLTVTVSLSLCHCHCFIVSLCNCVTVTVSLCHCVIVTVSLCHCHCVIVSLSLCHCVTVSLSLSLCRGQFRKHKYGVICVE